MLDSPVDQIKSRLDILEVLSSYIRLHKAGRNYKALCPFHKEKTPSFMVSPERQIWHCFGCGLGGDIFSFVMQIEGMEFADALRLLARKAGVILKKQDPKLQSQRKRLYEICELGVRFFAAQLEKSSDGKKVLQYLKKRGLEESTIKDWQVGWAPNTRRALMDFLNSKGYTDQEISQAGLAATSETTNIYYDRFRSRIMFPIADLSGQVVGFGGRIFPDSKKLAKYINTPQGPIYDKSRLIFGLDKAKLAIKKEKQAIVVEGYTDVLMSHQTGIKETLASSGTALTEYQLAILKRYTDNLLLAFDMDLAGDTATKRAIALAQQIGFNIKVVALEKKDPAELIKENPQKWHQAINKAVPIMNFYFKNAFERFDSQDIQGKKQIGQALLPIIAKIPNKIEQAHWLQELSGRLKIEEKDLREEMGKITKIPQGLGEKSYQSQQPAAKNRCQKLEERLAAILLSRPEYYKKILKKDLELVSDPELKEILTKCSDKKKFEISKKFEHLIFLFDDQKEENSELEQELEACLVCLNSIKIKKDLVEITWQIKEAEKNGQQDKLSKLLKNFSDLSKNLSKS